MGFIYITAYLSPLLASYPIKATTSTNKNYSLIKAQIVKMIGQIKNKTQTSHNLTQLRANLSDIINGMLPLTIVRVRGDTHEATERVSDGDDSICSIHLKDLEVIICLFI